MKIDTSEKEKVNSLISKLEAAIQADDSSSMQSLTEEVKQAMVEIGQKIYSQDDTTGANASDNDAIRLIFSW